MKKVLQNSILTLLALVLWQGAADGAAVRDTLRAPQPYSEMYLDTVQVVRNFNINNYSMVGVETGLLFNSVMFNPDMKTETMVNYGHYGVMFTHYQKMFGFMPYFGYRVGFSVSKQGFAYKEDKENHTISTLFGDTIQENFDIVEAPFLLHAHMDSRFFKLFADVGIFGAYRLNISRKGYMDFVPQDQFNFKPFEKQFDYGLQGGIGVGFVFKPVEIHVSGNVRYSWGSLFEPDYASPYYYRYATPFDFIFTVGVHYHLTRRTGKTTKQLKQEAYDFVYGVKEDISR